jgi:hypothetical protein
MSSEDNKAVIRRFLEEGFNRRDLTVVDEVFAPNHFLVSPETGTEQVTDPKVIKEALEDYHTDGSGAGCTIINQIAEADWVATSYALGEGYAEHMGIIMCRLADGKIQETFVVAREVSSSAIESDWVRRKILN